MWEQEHNDSSELATLLKHTLTLRRQRPRAVDHVRRNRLAVRRGRQGTAVAAPPLQKAPASPAAAALTSNTARNFVKENCLVAAKAGRRAAPAGHSTAEPPLRLSAPGHSPLYLLKRRIEQAAELANAVSTAWHSSSQEETLALTYILGAWRPVLRRQQPAPGWLRGAGRRSWERVAQEQHHGYTAPDPAQAS